MDGTRKAQRQQQQQRATKKLVAFLPKWTFNSIAEWSVVQ